MWKSMDIRDSQHGLAWVKSYHTNLEDGMKITDKGRAVDVVNMDFSKAFKKVPHRQLDQKMWMVKKVAKGHSRIQISWKYNTIYNTM